jgi:DNA polymerase IV (DinB-like DNA polymerase)
MDYFFAQIEERENPRFKGKPVVVGADPKGGQGRGVVSTANYEARKYGIHSAMPISIAYELCPEAIFLPVNMELYQQVSERIMKIIKKYSQTWEIVSLDEAYLDLSFLKKYKKTKELAKKLKDEIFAKEKLTSTVGIGQNKLIAKMASEKGKPNGLLIIKPNQVKEFLDPLDVEDLPGIGPKTAAKLRAIDINKIKDLKKISKSKLQEMFGKVGEEFYEKARGIDETPVTSEEIIKSIGRQITFERDTRNSEIIFKGFDEIIKDIYRQISDSNPPTTLPQKRAPNKLYFKTLTVICRFHGFETHTKSKTLIEPTNNLEILKKEAKNLLLRFLVENPKLIRLIGLRVKISN